ncbi:EAL domain-containing protein [Crocosphaera sp. UHCC 0190]|uniref:two-component system response regulator n=1 Tax=Crocosphaera sp. UHCC 0190 TaxID=3110246 RepID=UPI002B210E07|nr:EAL domain-containing protein [Crocosphaera sp. UHCC 0190]MEA5510714.1 EAL domain-containing protein [Crocosphaera sp. UHCC 0190]
MSNPQDSPSPANILIVDDKQANLRILSTMLEKQGYKVRAVMSGGMAIMAAQTMPPDLILLDIKMPDLDGYEVCQQLKKRSETCQIPVIFLSALQDVADKIKAFQVGGVDYITKPFQFEEVLARVSTHLALRTARYQLQQLNLELEQRVKERTLDLEQAQEQLLYDALHDKLTKLPNRSLFLERVERARKRGQEENNYLFAVLLLDLDRFKVINESDGHAVGDRLLIAISRKLETLVSSADTVARLGGDEFAILLDPIDDVNEALRITQQVKEALTSEFQLQERTVFTSPSIGLALSLPTYESAEEIVRDADIAMARAKQQGRGRYEIFNQEMHLQALKLLDLETDLRQAIERQEFQVYYQPIMTLNPPKLVGFEALIRWQHPDKGFISPVEFIPVAEETGLIIPIGQIVLDQVCCQIQDWQTQFPQATVLKVGVNLSSQQLKNAEIIQQIDETIAKTRLTPKNLKVEITESLLMENTTIATHLLTELKKRSIDICLDDFGTGYSSLSYLHRFPVDTLKIDRSFVNCIGKPEEKLEIIQSIITLAHNLNMDVVAEGIETQAQLDYLRSLDCDLGQGYFFNRPLPPEEAIKLLS